MADRVQSLWWQLKLVQPEAPDTFDTCLCCELHSYFWCPMRGPGHLIGWGGHLRNGDASDNLCNALVSVLNYWEYTTLYVMQTRLT